MNITFYDVMFFLKKQIVQEYMKWCYMSLFRNKKFMLEEILDD